MLTFGIEEEFVFLDCATLTPLNVAPEIHVQMIRTGTDPTFIHREFFQSQIEYASPVFGEAVVAAEALRGFRTKLLDMARASRVTVAGVGTPFQTLEPPAITPGSRYRRVVADIRGITADHHINGMHVHVGVPDRGAGIRVLNAVRRWLPVLLAMSANSPFWKGVDTGFASWRAIHSRRWTTAGCPPHFIDEADYDRRLSALTGVGATSDSGTVCWYGRLSAHQQTVEFRVADAQLGPGTSVLLAVLSRALVAVELAGATSDGPDLGPELLDAALWHAARDGLCGSLLDPTDGAMVPAANAVRALLREARPGLAESGDLELAQVLTSRLIAQGSGAQRQRSAHATGGTAALGALIEELLVENPMIG